MLINIFVYLLYENLETSWNRSRFLNIISKKILQAALSYKLHTTNRFNVLISKDNFIIEEVFYTIFCSLD